MREVTILRLYSAYIGLPIRTIGKRFIAEQPEASKVPKICKYQRHLIAANMFRVRISALPMHRSH